jgi:uncharacterized membrane protein YcaP (DUF421 family)
VTDWSALFAFSVHPLEMVLRGSAVYWFLFCLFRFVLRRDAGSVAIADIMLLVLIADAAQNAMAGGYQSLADGAVLVVTLAAWNYGLDAASYRFAAVRRVLEAPPLRLVADGHVIRANLRRELVTMQELHAALRQQGVEHLADVKSARMEADGRISVIRREGSGDGADRGGGADAAGRRIA